MMRILVRGYDGDPHMFVTEIVHACYNDEIEISENETVAGLEYLHPDGDWGFIPGISEGACRTICAKLLQEGWCDLTSFGYAHTEDFDDNNENDANAD